VEAAEMDTRRAQQLFYEHASAMAYVAVEKPDGTHSIATAFHVGEGVFVTSRHVVEGNSIREIKITEPVGLSTREHLASQENNNLTEEEIREYDKLIARPDGEQRLWRHYFPPLELASGPHFARGAQLDVAAFRVKDIHPAAAIVKLGVHLDDWVYRAEWRLSDAIVLGYTPDGSVDK
jgi:hypothetical protein